VFPVDFIQVAAWIILDLLTSQLQKLIALAEDNSLNRAHGGAGRPPSLLGDSVIAKSTLAHLWEERIMVIVGGNLKRTGHHAVATADTLRDVVVDCAVILFGHGGHDTSRDAARVLAVHALDLDKGRYQLIPLVKPARIVAVYHSVGSRGRPALAVQNAEIIKGHPGRR
jgi:hypothetical protein